MREVLEQEAEMFKIGDYVAHYKEGVCEVVNIGKMYPLISEKEKYLDFTVWLVPDVRNF